MGGLSEGKAWSLLNLIMSLFALFSAILLLVTLVHRREETGAQDGDDFLEGLDQEAYGQQSAAHRLIVLRIPAIIMGVVPGILFLTLENIRLPLTWITQWTPLIGAFFIIDMVLVLIHYVVKKREKSDGHENDEKVKMKKIAH